MFNLSLYRVIKNRSLLSRKLTNYEHISNETGGNWKRQVLLFFLIRNGHTDIKVPDFNEYRRSSLKSPTAQSPASEGSRKAFSYLISTAASIASLYFTKIQVIGLVQSMAASADVLALAQIEINLNEIPEGKNVTFKWRGKPLFIRHRSAEQIAVVRAVPLATLRDPEDDAKRCCVPLADAGDFGPGGYYCPCHGSHFDGAGRIRKGPAPINLVIPQYSFLGENTLIVG